MKCILLASGRASSLLGQVLDRPFLQHMIEQLVARGVDFMRVVLPQSARDIHTLFGDGARWGIAVHYAWTDGEPTWADVAKLPEASGADLLLAGRAESLPFLPRFVSEEADGNGPAIYFEEHGGRARWSGWALLPGDAWGDFAKGLSEGNDWRDALRRGGIPARKVFLTHPSLSCTTEKELLGANRAALDGLFPGLFFSGKEVQPGIWMARAAKIPSTVTLHTPCYIGESSWIGNGCTIGPHAVIGPRCVVSRDTAIARSIVTQATFLGPGLEVADSLVDRSRVHNVRLGAEIEIEEHHVARGLDEKPSRAWWPF